MPSFCRMHPLTCRLSKLSRPASLSTFKQRVSGASHNLWVWAEGKAGRKVAPRRVVLAGLVGVLEAGLGAVWGLVRAVRRVGLEVRVVLAQRRLESVPCKDLVPPIQTNFGEPSPDQLV